VVVTTVVTTLFPATVVTTNKSNVSGCLTPVVDEKRNFFSPDNNTLSAILKIKILPTDKCKDKAQETVGATAATATVPLQ